MTLFLTILAVIIVVAASISALVMFLGAIGRFLWWLNGDIYKRKFEIIRKRKVNKGP